MTFIDWSDAEEMLGLLVEYVSDERIASAGDVERSKFLDELTQELEVAADAASGASADDAIRRLRAIRDAQPKEFAGDEVLGHLAACIEELERIAGRTSIDSRKDQEERS